MTMSPALRKLALTAHVTVSVGWLGALAVFLAQGLATLVSADEQVVRAASLAMSLTAWFVILPLCFASLITGLVQSLGTAWGVLQHYWVLSKLLLTSVATIVLLLKLQTINHLTHVARTSASVREEIVGLQTSLAIHAAGGLLILITA